MGIFDKTPLSNFFTSIKLHAFSDFPENFRDVLLIRFVKLMLISPNNYPPGSAESVKVIPKAKAADTVSL